MLYVTSEEAIAAYKVCPYAGHLTIFQADHTFSVPEGLGWREVAWGKFEVKHVAGGHVDLLKEPYVQDLAGILRDCIETAMKGTQSG